MNFYYKKYFRLYENNNTKYITISFPIQIDGITSFVPAIDLNNNGCLLMFIPSTWEKVTSKFNWGEIDYSNIYQVLTVTEFEEIYYSTGLFNNMKWVHAFYHGDNGLITINDFQKELFDAVL